MVDTPTWAWLQPTPLPGFAPWNPDNLDSGLNGLPIDVSNYQEYALRDLNGDGIIEDLDNDDGSSTAAGEGLVFGGAVYRPQEVALYDGSTVVAGGVTYTVPLVVTLSETGNWGVRILDGHAPPGAYPADFTIATLGTFNGTEAALFQDGKQVAKARCPGDADQYTGPLLLGQYTTGGDANYQVHGKITGVKIYHRALKPAEITATFKAGKR